MRRSERSIPFVSDEEVIVIHQEGQPNVLAKLMDLSEWMRLSGKT